MASNVAPPKNTGGGGFVFETNVCVRLMAAMLVGEPLFGAAFGPPIRLDFQTIADGWLLDDVLVTTAVGEKYHRFAFSIKSNSQLTATAAPKDFIVALWKQWLREGKPEFNKHDDCLGMITAPLSAAAKQSVDALVTKVRVNDPLLFPERLATPNWASAEERELFGSFACPSELGREMTAVDTALLLQRVCFLQYDFEASVSNSENGAIQVCQRAVRSGTLEDAQVLWKAIHEVARQRSSKAGHITLADLVECVRRSTPLADYPDHAGDWNTLDANSERDVGLVRDSIAGSIHLFRTHQVTELYESLNANAYVALLGSSGVGKSALAKALFEQRKPRGERTLWLDVSTFDHTQGLGAFEASLKLQYSLSELLATETGQNSLVIIDGVDRIYREQGFRCLALLFQAIQGESKSSGWRVLTVCQRQDWRRVLDELHRAGASIPTWRELEIHAPRRRELDSVLNAVPTLGHLFSGSRVASPLTNLKFLDVVVRRVLGGQHVDASTWTGESSVAEWFWNSEIARGRDASRRGKLAREIAQIQAEALTASISDDAIVSWLEVADILVGDGLLVRVNGDRFSFAHDIYGDWARFRILKNHRENLPGFLSGQHDSPVWHRAIRLFGIHLLESDTDVDEWIELIRVFAATGMRVVSDVLLEAPAFAMNAKELLDRARPHLMAEEGELLQRLLKRFMMSATVPHEEMLKIAESVGTDRAVACAAFRRPQWSLWPALLQMLHRHREDVLRIAAAEVAPLIEMWLEVTKEGDPLRRETAEIALLLGQRARAIHRDTEADQSSDDSKRYYRCLLLAALDLPNEVGDFAISAAELVPTLGVERRELEEEDTSSCGWLGHGVPKGPWPGSPLRAVDPDFRDVVLNSGCILPLFRVRAETARQVIFATLIQAPYTDYEGRSEWTVLDLGFTELWNWQPALFRHGPFLRCLGANFSEGLELVMLVVEFATERASEWVAEREVERLEGVAPAKLYLHDGTDIELQFNGDLGTYGWSAGLSCEFGQAPLPPATVSSALMALERYFYQRMDNGDDIAAEVTASFARCRSVAPLGVLVDVGKRQKELFRGPLRPLLSAPELYSGEICKIVEGRWHLMLGAFSQSLVFYNDANAFHSMEHRQLTLNCISVWLLLDNDEMAAFFTSVREWWSRCRPEGDRFSDIIKQMSEGLDRSNYEAAPDFQGGKAWERIDRDPPSSGQLSRQEKIDDQRLRISFPIRCRLILDEGKVLSTAELEGLWETWVRIAEIADLRDEENSGDIEYADPIAAGLAVFVLYDGWLALESSRLDLANNAIGFLVDTMLNNGVSGSADAFSRHKWDGFLAEIVATVWVRLPQDLLVRRLVAEMVFARRYETCEILFVRCSEHHAVLGEDFERLRRIAVDWAHQRPRFERLKTLQDNNSSIDESVFHPYWEDLVSWRNKAIDDFVSGELEPLSADWDYFCEAGQFSEFDKFCQSVRSYWLIDFRLIRRSHTWLPLPDDTSSAEERFGVLQFWRVALKVVLKEKELRKNPHEAHRVFPDDAWVLKNIARVVLQLSSDEAPKQFWAPILSLPKEDRSWLESFLSELHEAALTSTLVPAQYGIVVREIAQQFFMDPDRKRGAGYESLLFALLGIDSGNIRLWEAHHAPYVMTIRDVLSLWMENTRRLEQQVVQFTYWLMNPAAAAVRLSTLSWLLDCVRARPTGSVRLNREAGDAIARLLNVVWGEDVSKLRSNQASLDAFRGLLTWLGEEQNALGLELQGRIGSLE